MGRVFPKYRSDNSSLSSRSSRSSSESRSTISDQRHETSNSNFRVNVSLECNRRFRRTMEDVHTIVSPYLGDQHCGFFAVFDGHAGPQCSQLCGQRMPSLVAEELATGVPMPKALHQAFRKMDEQLATQNIKNSGSTAAVAVVRWENSDGGAAAPNAPGAVRKLYVANVGDTRAVLARGSNALRLSYDHRCGDAQEQRRIANVGGIVINNRVNGMLAVTRSLGDLYIKDYVLGDPYTTDTVLEADDDFLIVACDGIWDVCSDKKAVQIVRTAESLKEGCAALVKHALEEFSTDNITVMVISLHESKSQGPNENNPNPILQNQQILQGRPPQPQQS